MRENLGGTFRSKCKRKGVEKNESFLKESIWLEGK